MTGGSTAGSDRQPGPADQPASLSERSVDPTRPTAQRPDRPTERTNSWWRRIWRTWWRSPREIEEVGETPDYRFTLANERTFLAWVRTALALLAAGVAVVQLVPGFSVPGARHVLGIPLVVLSVIVSALGYRHWADRERSMRARQPLPVPGLPRVLALVVLAVSLAALVFVLLGGPR